jgi:aminopeptidase N
MQQLMLDTLLAAIATGEERFEPVVEAVRDTLSDPALDPAFIAEAVLLPTEAFIGDQMAGRRSRRDPRRAREALRGGSGKVARAALARRLCLDRGQPLRAVAGRQGRAAAAHGGARLPDGLGRAGGCPALALKQFGEADNMTDRQGALGILANSEAPGADTALAAFYERYRDDRWSSTNGSPSRRSRPATTRSRRSQRLLGHPDFTSPIRTGCAR